MDLRYGQLARLAIRHSLRMQPGERVLISTGPESVRFAEVIGQEVIVAGGHPIFRLTSRRVAAARLTLGNDDQIDFVHPAEMAMADCDCHIHLDAPTGRQLPVARPEAAVRRSLATANFRARMDAMRWVVVLQPTDHLARQLGLKFAACEDRIFRSTIGVDWQALSERAVVVKELFDSGSEVRIVAKGTDLRFSLAGRQGIVGAGTCNRPDGETHYAPVSESVEGTVSFPDPQFGAGGTITSMQLVFRHGEVVEATAREGLDRLQVLLGTDEGARRIGEFGIGLNPLLDRMTGNILLDEKIDGTVHLALGQAFPEAGGTNRSAIHWDMILDLRRGGEVWLDGRLVCQHGAWLDGAARPAKVTVVR